MARDRVSIDQFPGAVSQPVVLCRVYCVHQRLSGLLHLGDGPALLEDFWSCAAYANLVSGKEYGAAGQTLGSDTLVFEVQR